jgi:signal transduction histidine kinase
MVFEPKFTTKTSGMGLGLAMVKKIVETYGGEISFKTIKGEGTTFIVKLPLK